MMETGLHIGLAGWIKELRPTDDFFKCPAIPVAIDLVDLESAQSMLDVTKAAEFARLTNFVPRKSEPVDTTTKLWSTHRELLRSMNFAAEPWDMQEQAAYQTAFDTLYTTDSNGFRHPSEKSLWYNERQRAYSDVLDSSGSAIEKQQAMTDWIALGYKLEIEVAINTINRLTSRSSIIQAQDEQSSLDEPDGIALRYQSDQHFAPVYFSPLSAVSIATWMEVELVTKDVNRSLAGTPYSQQWARYQANRDIIVTFKYTVLDCSRPWFNSEIYKADDWKLSTEEGFASAGNGQDGILPAFVQSVYLVSVQDIKVSKPPQPNQGGGVTGHFGKAEILSAPLLNNKINVNYGVVNAVRIKPNELISKSLITNRGIVSTATQHSLIRLGAETSSQRVLQAPTSPLTFTKMNFGGKLRKLSIIDQSLRYDVLAEILRKRDGNPHATSPAMPNDLTYIVGYGCKKIPLAPDTNLHYNWQLTT